MTSDTRIAAPQQKPPIWRNATFLKWAAQIGVLTGLVALFVLLGSVAASNLTSQGRTFGWGFLSDPPGIQLSEGIFIQPESGLHALATGVVNMLRITASGIIAATFLGIVVGVSRLSTNWLLSRIATVFVEIIRNIPLIIQIVFWFILATQVFPGLDAEDAGTRWIIVSNKGISIPWFFPTETFWQWVAVLVVGAVVARFVYRRQDALREETGRDTGAVRYALLTFVGAAAVGWFVHPIAGAVGWVWQLVAGVISAVPQIAWQLLFAAIAVFIAARWIRGFLDSLRSPAGLAKLTDDDYFRVGLAGFLGVLGAAVFLFAPSVTGLVTEVAEFLFRFFDQKFDFLRTGSPLRFARPDIVLPGRFPQIGEAGMTMSPAFFGLWIAVTLYTAAFIAEIVRGGVLAVPKGQSEAGLAMGLKRSQLLRMIILPQAFRIILPPIGNQYLNLAKNTSLGIAIGYAEVVAVGSTLSNQTGQALQTFALWMGFYLTVSLTLSSIVNYYNRKLQLVER